METQQNSEPKIKKIKLDFKDSKYATGRRKKSIAKVWLKKGSGTIHVNGIKMNDYFQKQNLQTAIFRHFNSIDINGSRSFFHPNFCYRFFPSSSSIFRIFKI